MAAARLAERPVARVTAFAWRSPRATPRALRRFVRVRLVMAGFIFIQHE
jgi:hypothetical protein